MCMEVVTQNQRCVGLVRYKLIRLSLLMVSLFLTGAVSAKASASSQPAIRVITEDWAPYNYEEAGEVKGYSTEIVKLVMAELGEQYPIEIFPGARGEKMLDTLPNILHFSLFRTPEREKKYKWIGPISEQTIFFYKRKGDPQVYETYADIRQAGMIIVPHRGQVASRVAAQGITNVIRLSDRNKQFELLFNDRAKLMVNVSPLGVAHYLKSMGKSADALVPTQVKLLEFPLYIACSKEVPDEVIHRWQAALEKVQATEEYKQLHIKYLE